MLLNVVGKVVARVIQGRLQKLAEEELPESQCGFRKGRGCMDMVFAVRQLIEKSWEYRERLFITFVDLKKAYDSVPSEAVWRVLKKLGVPEVVGLSRYEGQNMLGWEVDGPNHCGQRLEARMLYGTCTFQPLHLCSYGEVVGECT